MNRNLQGRSLQGDAAWVTPMSRQFAFDQPYYDRFYRDPATRVATRGATTRLGRFVCSYLRHLGQPVRSVLDLGCGLGLWREVVRRHHPDATYRGVELSRYLCRTHGWQRGSVVDYRASHPFDLVICHGVLQYLDAGEARRAIRNLARLCGGAMFLEALTVEDWERNCDQSVTDGDVYLRPAAWYRLELGRHFTSCGGGVFLSARSPAVVYELEKAE